MLTRRQQRADVWQPLRFHGDVVCRSCRQTRRMHSVFSFFKSCEVYNRELSGERDPQRCLGGSWGSWGLSGPTSFRRQRAGARPGGVLNGLGGLGSRGLASYAITNRRRETNDLYAASKTQR